MWVSCCQDVNELIWSWCSHCLEDRGRCLGPWASEQSGAFGWSAVCQKGLASHHPGLETLGLSWEQRWSREVVNCLLLVEVVYVAGDQKGDFKNLKQEKWNCYPLEKFSSFSKETEGLAMSGLHLQVPRPPEFHFNQIKQWSTADPSTTQGLGTPILWAVRNLCVTLQRPLWPRFLCIHSSTSMDSANHGSCSNVVFTIEKQSMYKWTCAVHTCAVQESTVLTCSTPSIFPLLKRAESGT